MELLRKGWSTYLLFLVPLVLVVYSPVNWTLRSVAYSLQDGCLASIGTSYNEDSERYAWGLRERYCRNGDSVCHVSWVWEARTADRFDPPTQHGPHLPSLVMPKREEIVWCAVRTRATPPLLLSTKWTSPHSTQTVPRHLRLLATLPPSCIQATTP